MIAVDGKTMRGACTDRRTALDHATGTVLVQRRLADRSKMMTSTPSNPSLSRGRS